MLSPYPFCLDEPAEHGHIGSRPSGGFILHITHTLVSQLFIYLRILEPYIHCTGPDGVCRMIVGKTSTIVVILLHFTPASSATD